MAPVSAPDAAIVEHLRSVGYRGPAIIARRTVSDEHGTRPIASALYLPERGMETFRRADAAGRGASVAVQRALVAAAEVAPDDLDPQHNSRIEDLGFVVAPSRLNGPASPGNAITLNLSFISYDYSTDRFYTVPGGEVIDSRLTARDSSAGHWHGSRDTLQKREALRVGRLVPARGTFTGSFTTQWHIAEVSNEVRSDFQVRESGGPNDGDVNWFLAFEWDGVRVQGLRQIPPNPIRYILEGGTNPHPNQFNDFGTPVMINAIQGTANAFYDATAKPLFPGELTKVNDIALMYGGRFDVGQKVGEVFNRCTDAAPQYCWQYSHYEHRRGDEVDIKNVNWGDEARKKMFYDALKSKFESIKPEGDHYHARTAASAYIPK